MIGSAFYLIGKGKYSLLLLGFRSVIFSSGRNGCCQHSPFINYKFGNSIGNFECGFSIIFLYILLRIL